MDIQEKYNKLISILQDMGSVAIGFSGGVDSTLLARVAIDELGKKALCVTLHESIHAHEEIEDSKALIKEWGGQQIVVTKGIIEEDFIKYNPADRCYHCKTQVFGTIADIAREHRVAYVADGSNMDDLNDYRPGMRALQELSVRSPLREAELTKAEIRILSKQLGLPTWNKPAYACLASRIPYGNEINEKKLRMVEEGEVWLRSKGIVQCRVRHHGEIARIEVAPEERNKLYSDTVLDEVSTAMKKIGFTYVSIEAGGYQMGNLNTMTIADQ